MKSFVHRYNAILLQMMAADSWVSGSVARLYACILLVCVLTLDATALADPLLTYPIEIKGHRIRVELANSPETRQKGLMFRPRLAKDSGMIFIFPKDQTVSMWMKNTQIPLSVAFIDADGKIVNIEDMQPHDETTHVSDGKVRFALETNQGWFEDKKIRPGAQLQGLDQLPPAR